MRGQTEQPHRLTPVGFAPPQDGSWGSRWSCLCSTQEGSGLGQGADEASLVAGVGVCTPRWRTALGSMLPPLSPPRVTSLPFGLRLEGSSHSEGIKNFRSFF